MFDFTPIVNAAGSFTPVGVSRSSSGVAAAAGWALQHFLVIDELLQRVDARLAAFSGMPAGTVTHCTSASVVLSVAAAITGRDPQRVARLPDTAGLANGVVLPGTQQVDYGHPIAIDVRMAGGRVMIAGDQRGCTLEQVAAALDAPGVVCLLLVRSRLATDPHFDFAAACELARCRGLPVIIDAAAQDMDIGRIAAWRPTAILCSAQKYLAAPTAGLVFGEADFIAAVRLQDRGIGRPMKPSKESLVGVLAALAEREDFDRDRFAADQARKVRALADRLAALSGIRVSIMPDPQGLPFDRIQIDFAGGEPAARSVTAAMKAGRPSIRVMEHGLARGHCQLELVALDDAELALLVEGFARALRS